MKMNIPESSGEFLFDATISNGKYVLQLLKGIEIDDTAVITLTDMGIKVFVDKVRSLQASTFIRKDLFESYELKAPVKSQSDPIELTVDLKRIIEFLGISMTNTKYSGDHRGGPRQVPSWTEVVSGTLPFSLRLSYEKVGRPLYMFLEESGDVHASTRCRINVLQDNNILAYGIEANDVEAKVVMRSIYFKEIWSDLDFTGDLIEFRFYKEEAELVIQTKSELATSELTIDLTNVDLVKDYKIETTKHLTYQMRFMKQIMKALDKSMQIGFFSDINGLLSISFAVPVDPMDPLIDPPDESFSLIEYYCLPQAQTDDDPML